MVDNKVILGENKNSLHNFLTQGGAKAFILRLFRALWNGYSLPLGLDSSPPWRESFKNHNPLSASCSSPLQWVWSGHSTAPVGIKITF